MQKVSENWREAHKQTLLNESFVEVSLEITDPDALEGISSVQDNGAIYISDSSIVTNEDNVPVPYCTLEQNLWCLDGNRKAIPESEFGVNGYVSDVLSDDTCVFSTRLPVITISFEDTFEKPIPGVTITWSNTYGEYADTFEVIAYNGDNIVASKEMVGNKSVKTIILADISKYNKIAIFVKKWCLPNHRARVEEIFVGLKKVYGKGELFDYSHTQSVDPVSTSLPKMEIKFSVDNVGGEYNPYNTNGLAKYLMERQEVKSRYGLKMNDGSIEWIKGGTFYLSEWYAKQNGMSADFTARDSLEFMSDIYYESHDLSERTLLELVNAVLNPEKLPSTIKWVVDEEHLGSIKTKAPLPNDTRANCLQLIANAGRCVLYQDRTGTLRIEPLKEDKNELVDYEINAFNSYSKSEITLSKPIKQVNVKVYFYVRDEKGIASTSSEKAYTEGENILGETITIDNPLVTDEGVAEDLGEWLYTHLNHRMTLDSSWRADVRLDALDIVRNKNDYNTNRVRMTNVELKYNGAFRATGKGKVI